MDEKIKTVLAELRAELKKIYGERLKELILFGSQARGEADPESDIDVAVILAGEVNPLEEIDRTVALISDLCVEHGWLVSLIFLAEKEYQQGGEPLIERLSRDGVSL